MQELDSANPPAATPEGDSSLRLVWLVVLIALAARIAYMLWFSRYELVEDEAQYWLWSKNLSWSYSTKGPGVAWAIWLSTSFLGDAEWAVRLPTVIASAIGALAAGALVRDLSAEARRHADAGPGWATPALIGGLGALAYTLAPALQAAGVLMTIDGSYVACWSVAAWAFWKAQSPKDKWQIANDGPFCGWQWALVGLAIALGFLFKYTMLLLVPGLVAFLLLRPRREPENGNGEDRRFFNAPSERWWFTAGIALALLGLAPVIVWNAQHGWPTVAHLIGHLGLPGGDVPIAPDAKRHWSPWWLPELLGQQLGMIGPWLLLAALACGKSRPDEATDPRRTGRRFLVCCAAPILIFYTIVALIAEPEGNWPMAAYATLLPLAAWAAADALAERRALRAGASHVAAIPTRVRWRVLLWNIGLWYAIVSAIPVHFLDRIGDAAMVLNRNERFRSAFKKVTDRVPRDPAWRIRGGKAMALHVADLLGALEASTEKTGFVLCQHYGRASQIAYYIPARFTPAEKGTNAGSYSARRKEKPLVLCAMQETGGRKSQFDYWPHTSLYQIGIMGHPAVVLTSTRPDILIAFQRMFDRLDELPNGEHLRGESKPDRSAFLGLGYKGPEEHMRAVREAHEKASKGAKPE